MRTLFLRLLSISIITGLVIPAVGCENGNKKSPKSNFIGVDMQLPSDAVIKRNDQNNTILILKGNNLSEDLEKYEDFLQLQKNNLFAEIALAFISANATLFKLTNPDNELRVKSVNEDYIGYKHIRFSQKFKEIPVWAAEINVHLNKENQVYLVQGRYIPTPEKIDISPVLNEKEIKRIAADDLKVPEPDDSHWHSEIIIFFAADYDARLAYRVVATISATKGWSLIIDAAAGDVIEKTPTVYTGSPSAIMGK